MAVARAYLIYPDGTKVTRKWTGSKKAERDTFFMAFNVSIQAEVQFGHLVDLQDAMIAGQRGEIYEPPANPEREAFVSSHKVGIEFKSR